jgi:hypothetical protein
MKLDLSPLASGGRAALPANGRIGDVRRNGWMYLLEHALLESSLKLAQPASENNKPEASQRQSAQDVGTRASGSCDSAARLPSVHDRGAEVDVMPGRPISGRSTGHESAQGRAAQAPEQPGNAAASADVSKTRPPCKAFVANATNDSAPVSASAWLAANMVAQSVQAGPGSNQSTQAPSPSPTGAPPPPMPATQVVAPSRPTSAIASAPFISAAAASSLDPAAPSSLRDGSAPSIARIAIALDARPDEPYGRRQLHVHVSEEGVQAWVRDADLSSAAALQVASAFFQNARHGGPKLAALSINGKKVVDTAFSLCATPDSFTHPGDRRLQPGDLEHGN